MDPRRRNVPGPEHDDTEGEVGKPDLLPALGSKHTYGKAVRWLGWRRVRRRFSVAVILYTIVFFMEPIPSYGQPIFIAANEVYLNTKLGSVPARHWEDVVIVSPAPNVNFVASCNNQIDIRRCYFHGFGMIGPFRAQKALTWLPVASIGEVVIARYIAFEQTPTRISEHPSRFCVSTVLPKKIHIQFVQLSVFSFYENKICLLHINRSSFEVRDVLNSSFGGSGGFSSVDHSSYKPDDGKNIGDELRERPSRGLFCRFRRAPLLTQIGIITVLGILTYGPIGFWAAGGLAPKPSVKSRLGFLWVGLGFGVLTYGALIVGPLLSDCQYWQ